MKRWLVSLFLVLSISVPVFAQDATEEAPIVVENGDVPVTVEDGGTVVVNDPGDSVPTSTVTILLIVVGGIFLVALVVVAYMQGKSTSALWQSTPAPLQAVGRFGLEYGLQEAYRTPATSDEEFLERLALALGYDVIREPDGRVILAPLPAPPAATTPQ